MPFTLFNSPELGITPWRLVLLLLAVLLLRRIPPLLLLYRWVPEISGWREALFSGHFGMCCHTFTRAYPSDIVHLGPVSMPRRQFT